MAKTTKTRVKTAALIVAAQDKAEAAAHIRRIGDLSREVKRLSAEMGDKQAAIEQEYRDLAAPYEAEIKALTAGVQAFCEANRQELTQNGKTKTVDFVTGLAKWRINPPSVKFTGKEAIIAYLKEKVDLVRFVRVKEDINKEAILNEAELFADGKVPGIRIVSGVEDFVVEPTDPDLAGV